MNPAASALFIPLFIGWGFLLGALVGAAVLGGFVAVTISLVAAVIAGTVAERKRLAQEEKANEILGALQSLKGSAKGGSDIEGLPIVPGEKV